MSRVQTRKEIETSRRELAQRVDDMATKLAEAEAKAVELTQAVETKSSEVRAEMQAQVDELTAGVEAKTGEVATLTEQVSAIEASKAEIVAHAETLTAEKAEAVTRADAEKVRADKAEQALKNPAYADAALADASGLPAAHVDDEADEAEKAAAKAEQEKEATPHYANYRELMETGQARKARAYWRENETAINDEQKTLIEQDRENDDNEEG